MYLIIDGTVGVLKPKPKARPSIAGAIPLLARAARGSDASRKSDVTKRANPATTSMELE